MRPILTAAAMRAAEQRVIDAGTRVEALMDRAGHAATEALWYFGGGVPALVLCGPGNNGGDGYVIARCLAARKTPVRVAAIGEPKTPAAIAARGAWGGPVETLADSRIAPGTMLIDALFGTGLTRGLDSSVSEHLARLAAAARYRVAVDLPSGVATDDGAVLSAVPDYHLTVALGSLKPAHLLQPAARHMGRVVTADIGLGEIASDLTLVERPERPMPAVDAHKYSRGAVGIIGGGMWGAAVLAASAAQRAGAGSVALSGVAQGGPAAIIRKSENAILADERLGALLVGPGLGRDPEAEARLDRALASGRPLILDADALTILGDRPLPGTPILTPHQGEFHQLFGELPGSKVDQARAAAARAGAVIVYKGPDTVIAAPDGRAALAWPGTAWLSSAGTGDVLAGVIAAMLAQGLPPFEAAQAGVWLHADAARRAGPRFIADDLVALL